MLPLEVSTFETRLQAVEARICAAVERAGRHRSEITLVAVSKQFSAGRIREGYQAGLRHFGENYVQEFVEKKPELANLPDATFHLIGHLQTNKAKIAAQLFEVIQTADSPKLLQRLDAAAGVLGKRLEVMLEIKLSGEESKSGASDAEVPGLLEVAQSCPNLSLTGFMTMPPWSEDAEQSRPYFQALRGLADKYNLPKLSMGMSNDFEVAIEEGATIIRIGTALFGARPKPQSKLESLP